MQYSTALNVLNRYNKSSHKIKIECQSIFLAWLPVHKVMRIFDHQHTKWKRKIFIPFEALFSIVFRLKCI